MQTITRRVPNSAVRSLYRSYLRQIDLLPHHYLRHFFRIKASDDVRSLAETDNLDVRKSRLRRVRKDVRKLKAANAGDYKAFNTVLDFAHGRRGKLKHELLEFLEPEPSTPRPPPLIPAVPTSRPPVFSPELTALLTSTLSRTTGKALKSAHISRPYTFPPRADPNSDEAKLLGPFSKRREVNMRWRFYSQEKNKVFPPLQVEVKSADGRKGSGGEKDEAQNEDERARSEKTRLAQVGIRAMGMQAEGVMEEILAIAGPAYRPPTMPRRQRRALESKQEVEATSTSSRGQDQSHDLLRSSLPFTGPLPNRFIRRRYQELLGRIPILTYTLRSTSKQSITSKPKSNENVEFTSGDSVVPRPLPGKYASTTSPSSIHFSLRRSGLKLPDADPTQLAWFESAHESERQRLGAAEEVIKRQREERHERYSREVRLLHIVLKYAEQIYEEVLKTEGPASGPAKSLKGTEASKIPEGNSGCRAE